MVVDNKGALAATGAGNITRNFPATGSNEPVGLVGSRERPMFEENDQVIVTGYGLGVSHDGGYAGYARVPSEWVVRVPDGLTAFEAMAIGTAGFTAALSIVQMELNGLSP